MGRLVIIGGGVAGAATAYFLARGGARDVVLVERAHQLGTESSGKNAAILRTLTGDPVTDALARRGKQFLCSPPRGFAEHPLVDPCGLVLTADAAGADELRAWFGTGGRAAGGQPLEPERVRALVPHLGPSPEAAYAFPAEGRIDVAALMEGLERGARAGGVAIETGAEVTELVARRGRVAGVRLAGGAELAAERTVLAAGAWVVGLARRAGSRIELRPTRRHLLVTAPDPAVDPRWPVLWHHGDSFYARPESGGMLLCGCDQSPVDPDHCTVDADVREAIAAKVARYLPGLADAGAAHFWAGLRTFAADHRFVVGPDPDLEGLEWVAGLGGHGMVCGAAVGELAAGALLDPARRDGPLARSLDPARLVPRRRAPASPAPGGLRAD